jgi:hypothetical protein
MGRESLCIHRLRNSINTALFTRPLASMKRNFPRALTW